MKCSVIIPYYQRKELLILTLMSLNDQDYPKSEFEVVLIDDGSDERNEVNMDNLNLSIQITDYKYPRSDKSGAAFARNKGIEHARGEYLIFLDCDLIVKSDFISQHISFHESVTNGDRLIQVGMRNDLHANQEVTVANVDQCLFDKDLRCRVFEIYSENMASLQGAWHLVFSNNISLARTAAREIEGFDESFKGWGFEDCEFGYKLTRIGVKVAYNPNIEAYHQYHDFVWDENRVLGWKKNLDYFIDKYRELPVMMQKIIEEYVDPDTKYEVVKKENIVQDESPTAWMPIWLNCFRRFENALRSAVTVHNRVSSYEITLTNPGIAYIDKMINEHPDAALTVITAKTNTDVIIRLQTEGHCARVRMFTY
jgi:glycosyltransferase involved in cell wall biosynthesis